MTTTKRDYVAVPDTMNFTPFDSGSGAGSSLTLLPAAPKGGKLYIWGIELSAFSATAMEFLDGANSLKVLNANLVQISPPTKPCDSALPWEQTSNGNAFNLNTAGGIRVSGRIIWSSSTND